MKKTIFIFFLILPAVSLRGEIRRIENVKITTEDGWTLNAKWMKPVKDNYVFLLVHSQKNDLTEWKKWLPELERYGYGYLSLDLRGHGLSTLTPEGTTTTYKSFSSSGFDNEYNKMIRDLEGAAIWISSNSVSENRIIPVGSWLGANLSIKFAAINKLIPAVVAIYPSLNINDVLSVNPLRVYGRRPILMVVGYKYERKYKEFQLLNDIAKASCGKENLFSIVEPEIKNASDISRSTIRRILEWAQEPSLPQVVDYEAPVSTAVPAISTGPVSVPDNEDYEN